MFFCTKYDHSSDLKLQYKILPVQYLLNMKSVLFFGNGKIIWSRLLSVKINHQLLKSDFLKEQLYLYILGSESTFMRNSFFKKTVPLWNTLPKNLETKSYSYTTIKINTKAFFIKQLEREVDTPDYGKTCWRDYQFRWMCFFIISISIL